MKRILLVRHGVAEPRNNQKKDINRSLTLEGKIYIGKIASLLIDKSLKPDLILTSPALRCKETAEILHKVFGPETGIQEHCQIYEGQEKNLFALLKELPESADCVMVVGHNPTLSELAMHLDKNVKKTMPKGSVLFFDIDIEKWENINEKNASIKYYVYPARKKSQKYQKLLKSVEGVLFEHLSGNLDIKDEKEIKALQKPIKKYSRKLLQNLEKYLQVLFFLIH
jgi:phosphohistidine phosphatase